MAMSEEQRKEFFTKWQNSEAGKEYEKLSKTQKRFSFAIQGAWFLYRSRHPLGNLHPQCGNTGPH